MCTYNILTLSPYATKHVCMYSCSEFVLYYCMLLRVPYYVYIHLPYDVYIQYTDLIAIRDQTCVYSCSEFVLYYRIRVCHALNLFCITVYVYVTYVRILRI